MDKKLQKKPNKKIIFKPRRRYRMLEGQQHITQLRKDLFSYNHHLYRIFTAIPKVDNNPPFLNPYTYVNPRKLRADAERLQQIDSENKMLLGRINAINRSPPKVDCWNIYAKAPSARRIAYNIESEKKMMENLKILHTIKTARSTYNKKIMQKRWNIMTRAFDNKINLSKVLHVQKPLDIILAEQPSLTAGLGLEFMLPRQKAFLDFSFKDGVRLGQIVIELYYEHAPKMVKNFLAHCDESFEHSYKNSRIHYAEKNHFITLGDVMNNNGRGGHSIYRHNIDLTPNELTPTRPGVLLAVPVAKPNKFNKDLTISQRIRQKPKASQYNSQFAITISSQCNSKQVMPVFGKIVKGNSVLAKINDMLRSCGTPLVTIIVSRCGNIPFSKEEEEIFKNVKAHMIAEGIDLDTSEEEDEDN